MRVGLAVVSTVLLLSTCAAVASADSLVFESAEPVALEGALAARFPEGSAVAFGRDHTGRAHVAGLHGTLTLWTWQAVHVETGEVGPLGSVGVREQTEEPRAERLELRGGNLTALHADEFFRIRVVGGAGSSLAVAGRVASSGVVGTLERDVLSETGPDLPVGYRDPSLAWTWARDWVHAGTFHGGSARLDGFPVPQQPVLAFSGPAAFQLDGGNVTLSHDGAERTVRLGNWRDEGSNGAPVEVFVRLIFEGTVGDASFPLPPEWGVAAPSTSWTLTGVGAWTGATGGGDVDGEPVAFVDEAVELHGTFSASVAPSGVASLGGATYSANGPFDRVVVGGASVATADPAAGRAAAAGGLAALLAALWLLPKLAAGLYTRIAPDAVLEHERRRRMYDIVTERPGVHKRELQREIALPWGLFTFHLRVLATAGYVRVAREGRYSLVFPTAAAPAGAVIPHPLARAAYERIPSDGTPVPLLELRRALDVSDQLLRYHLRTLETRGLVALERAEPRGTRVRRAGAQDA